jgi:hypothetical protein
MKQQEEVKRMNEINFDVSVRIYRYFLDFEIEGESFRYAICTKVSDMFENNDVCQMFVVREKVPLFERKFFEQRGV